MSVHIVLKPGMKLVATAVFHVPGPLFISLLGPAGVTFAAGWPGGPKEITNTSNDVWQFTVQASRHGPLGAEVPIAVVAQSGAVTTIAVYGAAGVDAYLVVTVMKAP